MISKKGKKKKLQRSSEVLLLIFKEALCSFFAICFLIRPWQRAYEVGIIIISILELGKLKLIELQW